MRKRRAVHPGPELEPDLEEMQPLEDSGGYSCLGEQFVETTKGGC